METHPSSSNPFAVAAGPTNAIVQVAQSKDAQEMQAALVVAKKYPRDEHEAFQRVITACKRRTLAEEASYLYSRGGTQITGASIRLLEAVAVAWGNIQSGVVELSNENGESRVQCFGWDIQTNVYDSKTFTVRHERYSKEGVTKLTDPRDQYELVANFAARRKRACLEAVIPRDVIDAALEQCDKTLKAGHTEPITDRVRKIVTAFGELGVTMEMIERRLQHKLEAVIEQEVVILRKIYTSLKDGMGKREDFFDLTATPKPAKFDEKKKEEEKKKDEKAESEAGLAPAKAAETQTTTAPAETKPAETKSADPVGTVTTPAAVTGMTPAQERMAKARAGIGKKKSAMSDPPTEPEPPPAEPEPEQPQPPQEQQPELPGGGQPVPNLHDQTYEMLKAQNVTEQEVLGVLKRRDICDAKIEQLVQLPDDILTDLLDNAQIIAAQVRMDKKAAARK
jgi:hypothetical protein